MPLKNTEKAVIVDALKEKYLLPTLREKLKMAKSSYYHKTRVSLSAKHEEERRAIAAVFHRSMSKKGCFLDNSACEGFLGRMKNFYGRSWQGVTLYEYNQQVNEYMIWYRDTRIKASLGGMSPAEFRIKTGLVV